MSTADYQREDFFNIPQKIQLSAEEYEYWWKRTDNFWTTLNTNPNPKDPGYLSIKKYYCKLKQYKQQESRSTGKRVTQSYPKGTCESKLTVHFHQDGSVSMITDGQHNHPINDSDLRKLPSVIDEVIAEEAKKQYAVAPILGYIRTIENIPGTDKIDYQKVFNVKAKYSKQNTDGDKYKGTDSARQDIDELVEEIAQNHTNYLYQIINDGIGQRVGIVWIEKEFGELMYKYGHLIQFDSTYKVNRHDWSLFNLVFRDNLGVWVAGAHMLINRE